jgi:hypothetical protein
LRAASQQELHAWLLSPCIPLPWNKMANYYLEKTWKQKSDEALVSAGNEIHTYNEEASQVIRAELSRRGLPFHPAPSQNQDRVEQNIVAQVRVIDFDMPFGSMILLMIKWALAAIPAIIILTIILTIIGFVVYAVGVRGILWVIGHEIG